MKKIFFPFILVLIILLLETAANPSYSYGYPQENYTKFKKAVHNKTTPKPAVPETTSPGCVRISSIGGIHLKNKALSVKSPEYKTCLNDRKAYARDFMQTLKENTSCIPGGAYSVVVKPEDLTGSTILTNYHISRSSGNNIADKNTLDAMKKTLPFSKPFPASCSILDYSFEITFMYNCANSDYRKCDPHWHIKD